MCTVSFLPKKGNGFILTSNRDEDINRPPALFVRQYKINGIEVYFPKDRKGGGSWIASGANGYTLCLLNGAFKPHIPIGGYKKSRGLVLLDFFNYSSPEEFSVRYDFTNIEPFTLLFVSSRLTGIDLHELKWDGENVILSNPDPSLPHIWSSVTLYTPLQIQERQRLFHSWVEKYHEFSKDDILLFHHLGGTLRRERDLVISVGEKKTVSICCVYKTSGITEMLYEDLLSKESCHNIIPSS